MGIFSRISDIFRSNVNDALDKAEDNEKMLKQMVLDMEESVNKTTIAVANAIANQKNLERKLEKAKSESADWEKKATFALTQNREDMARAALERKSIADKNIASLQPLVVQATATANKSREQLNVLKTKLDEARMRESTLIARSQTAKSQTMIAKQMAGVGKDSFSKFDKFEAKIEGQEAQADAFQQLAGESTSLDDQFAQLGSATVDQDLLALKAKMGLISDTSTAAADTNPIPDTNPTPEK